jgi:hypothetical protein
LGFVWDSVVCWSGACFWVGRLSGCFSDSTLVLAGIAVFSFVLLAGSEATYSDDISQLYSAPVCRLSVIPFTAAEATLLAAGVCCGFSVIKAEAEAETVDFARNWRFGVAAAVDFVFAGSGAVASAFDNVRDAAVIVFAVFVRALGVDAGSSLSAAASVFRGRPRFFFKTPASDDMAYL